VLRLSVFSHCFTSTLASRLGVCDKSFQYLKVPTRRMERDFSQGCVVIGQGGTAVKYKRADLD